VSSDKKNSAIISTCTCKNTYQDEKYGKDRRVFNSYPMADGGFGHRCTVCCRETTGRAGGGVAFSKRRARLELLNMTWAEFIRKAGASAGKTYDSKKGR